MSWRADEVIESALHNCIEVAQSESHFTLIHSARLSTRRRDSPIIIP